MDRGNHYREILLALVTAIGILTFVYLVTGRMFAETRPTTPKSNFAVVDTYSYENKTCSVIRYTTPSTNWEYFLDCTK